MARQVLLWMLGEYLMRKSVGNDSDDPTRFSEFAPAACDAVGSVFGLITVGLWTWDAKYAPLYAAGNR